MEKTTFAPLDIVVLKDEYKGYSSSYKKIVGKKLIVKSCKMVNLNDIIFESLRLDTVTDGVKNPYLAKHFKKVGNGKTTKENT